MFDHAGLDQRNLLRTMTSEVTAPSSSALRIAEVSAGAGRIGITLCPGKKGASLFGGTWDRDLAQDIAAIKDWGASAVVTLIEDHEFELLSVRDLPDAIAEAGREWHHLPITDVQAPDRRFETRWWYAGARIRERLRAGDSVLVHCRGGLGRAGSVAARLLVEFGAEPSEAIARVRAVRPGAIETAAQERWVRAQHRIDADSDRRAARELACLLGGAIGDALGYRVEFDSLKSIRSKHGPAGIRLERATGTLVVSDDTQMTLFTLEGQTRALRENSSLLECMREAYLDWYRTQQHRGRAVDANGRGLLGHPVIWQARAPGNTCMSALRAGGHGTVQTPVNGSKGCGGVMRTAPIGFLPESTDDATVYRHGVEAAAVTHGHPDGFAPAGVMALATRQLLNGHPWDEVVAAGLDAVTRAHPVARGTVELLSQLQRSIESRPNPNDAARFGQGWVGDEALAVGMYAALAASGFAEAIEAAANHDGDSDSTASIAGQLYGARHGLAALPAEAIYRLDVLQPLLEVHREWSDAVRRGVSRDGAPG
jgi:ADP-ribosyl-[dinitrogen reductase] hydrolase